MHPSIQTHFVLSIAFSLLFIVQARAQHFTEVNIGLSDILCCRDLAWGDYDNDGDLDLVAAGIRDATPVARIYANEQGQFVDIEAQLADVDRTVAWGDYDNDGDLDLFLSGNGIELTRIYRNERGTFTDIAASLGDHASSVDWGDYDNDGDLDLMVVGNGGHGYAPIYENDHASFTEVQTNIGEANNGSARWGDYDNDGDLDLVVAGYYIEELDDLIPRTRLYQNVDGTLVTEPVDLVGILVGNATWADYDNDGDLDLLLTGIYDFVKGGGYQGITRLYQNEAGTLTETPTDLPDLRETSVAWGDYDQDGDLDLFFSGNDTTGFYHNLYRNEDGRFELDRPGSGQREGFWGDYDNDGDLDLLITRDYSSPNTLHLYRNDSPVRNQPPEAPPNLHLATTGVQEATLCWNAASDDTTPRQALSYNLRVGTTPGGSEVMSPMAIVGGAQDGRRLTVAYGNAGQRLCHTLKKLSPNITYYASVQALDHSFAGSSFSAELPFAMAGSIAAEEVPSVAAAIQIEGVSPNPFTSTAAIAYQLAHPGTYSVRLYDVLGRDVLTLSEGFKQAGRHHVEVEGTALPSGVYLVRIIAKDQTSPSRLLIRL